jgi:hypothetical protein
MHHHKRFCLLFHTNNNKVDFTPSKDLFRFSVPVFNSITILGIKYLLAKVKIIQNCFLLFAKYT